MDFRQRRPSAAALAWVERQLGNGYRVVGWRRMTGGLTSAVHRLTVQRGPARLAVVLRQYERSLAYDMAKFIEHRRQHPDSASRIRPSRSRPGRPELLAACPARGRAGGNPAILMTRLAGRLDLSHPADPGDWLRQMAAAAAAIHDAAVSAPAFESWFDTAELAVPATATRPGAVAGGDRRAAAGPGPGCHQFHPP